MMTTIILCLALSGCASLPPGVQMTDAERVACEAEGCSVWTVQELRKLIGAAMLKGYQAGKGSI